MEQLIKLYMWKLDECGMTREEADRYEHLIELYMKSLENQLKGVHV